MKYTNAFAGVGVAGITDVERLAPRSVYATAASAAHPAGAAAAITPQRERRTATAIDASVDRGTS